MTDQENNELIEKADNSAQEQEKIIDGKPYDYVVTETAVGGIKGIKFTVDAFYNSKDPEKGIYTTTLDIERSRFVDIYEGDIVALSDTVSVQIVSLKKESESQKGKVYFKLIE